MRANSSVQPESSILEVDLLILAGGKSTRMGRDKALLNIEGCTLLEHHIRKLSPYVRRVFVSGDNERQVDLPEAVECLRDFLPGHQGPLSGLYAGFMQSEAAYLWVLPCDSFGVEVGLFTKMQGRLEESGADVVCCQVEQRTQPLLSVIKHEALVSLDAYLANGHRAVMPWIQSLQSELVTLPSAVGFETNINTPEQYEQLLNKVANEQKC